MFCNVPLEGVIEAKDVDHSIYEMPLMLQRERLDDLVCRLLQLTTPSVNMTHWQEIIRKLIAPQHRVRVGVVGKYIGLQDAYKSVYEALIHGGIGNDCGVEIVQVDSEEIERDGAEKMLRGLGGILVPGGFGERGIEGKILAAKYARENKIPYLGLCLGMQIATIEFARNVLKLEKAHSTEFDENSPHPVIALLDAQKKVTKKGGHDAARLAALPVDARHEGGGTLRLVRHQRTPPPPLRIQQRLPRKIREGRIILSGNSPDGKLRRGHRTERPSVLSREPGFILNSRASRTSRIRCSKGSSRRRIRTISTSRFESSRRTLATSRRTSVMPFWVGASVPASRVTRPADITSLPTTVDCSVLANDTFPMDVESLPMDIECCKTPAVTFPASLETLKMQVFQGFQRT